MKKRVLLTALALIFVGPALAMAQNTGGSPPTGGMPPSGENSPNHWGQNSQGGPGGGHEDGKRFEEHKAEILRHINEHLAEVEQRKHCVEAANNHEALRACAPQHGEGHGGSDGEHGEGGHGEQGQPPQ